MSPACCRTPPGGAYVLPDMIRENIISQGDFTMGKKRPALRLKQIRPRLRTVLSASLVTALVLLNGATNAQALRITNAAAGMACYSSQDLLTAHSAIGFYNFDKVRALIAQDKCFVMKEHWRPKITDERVIGGVGVKMVHVRLDNSGQSVRIAWSLLKNFDFIGDTE